MATRIGTHHYASIPDAKRAYCGGYEQAIKEGRIVVGKPDIKEGQRLLADHQGRYWIEDAE